MPRENLNTPKENKQTFYKLSEAATKNGFRPTYIDGNEILVMPATEFVRVSADGRKFPDQFVPPVGIVKDAGGEEISRTEGGFIDLSPAQVYELVSNGVIILSNKRPEHKEIFHAFLKNNTVSRSPEDY